MDIHKFLEIEKKYGLYDIKVEDVNVWIYSRYAIWDSEVCAAKWKLMPSHRVSKKKKSLIIKNLLSIIKNILQGWLIFKGKHNICFIAHERRQKINNYYRCVYTEELSEYYKNSITIEQPFMFNHFKPVKNTKIIYTDYIFWYGEICAALHVRLKTRKYKKLYKKVSNIFNVVLDEIIDEYGVSLNKERIFDSFVRRIIIVKADKKIYRKLIENISPKIIVEVVHYSLPCMIINEIAADLGIKTIELQHGILSDHLAYQYAENKKINQLPQMLFTFSEFWNEICKLPSATEVVATGFPHFENQMSITEEKRRLKTKKINILFLSQGTISNYLAQIAIELYYKMDRDKYHIIYKLHPAEYLGWKERYINMINTDITVIDNNEVLLYDLFEESSIQIGVYSTAIYEGLGFNLKTFIFNIAHSDAMKVLVEKGYARYFNSVEELYEMIEKNDNLLTGSDILWKKNAIINMVEIINKKMGI